MHLDVRRFFAVVAIGALVLPTAVSAQTAPVPGVGRPTHQELTTTVAGGKDWITYGGSLKAQRYSTLNQINQSNVSQLKGAWLTRLGSARGSKYRFEADPLVIDGVMYIPTGNDDIFALDAKTGKKMWEYFSDIPQVNNTICCGWDNRGVGIGEGMVFSGQLDATIVGLDQATGRVMWKTQLEDYREGYSITGATRYYDGLVFTGMSGGEYGIRGRMYALDAKTGREVWRFYTVPGPGDIGADTWPMNDPDPYKSQVYLRGGGTVWQAPSIDPELGMMYFTTGNVSPYEGTLRAGDNLFTVSFLALDYKTGQYRWHFQQVRHELWDFDLPSPTVLFEQEYNGVMKKGIFQASKTGWVYFLDRTNGQPLVGMEYKPVPQEPRQNTADTQPYPVGDAFVTQCADPVPGFPLQGCIFTPYWDVPVLNHPLGSGGSNWNPPSYHPPTGYTFVSGLEQNGAYAVNLLAPLEFEPGKGYTRTANATALGSPINSTITALDSRTNKIVWQIRKPGADNKGFLTTVSDLAFTGNVDGNLSAYNVRTGDELWKFQVGWGIGAPPMTYEVDGVQYVAVAAGGNRGGVTTLDGDAVWAFSLNGTIDEVAAPPPAQAKVALGGTPVRIGGEVGGPTTLGGTWVFEGTVRTLDFRFDPQRVAVPAGTTLSWQNLGSTNHTVTSSPPGAFDSGDFGAGETYSRTFDSTGTFIYICTPHPWMIGEITVQ
jgi:quinohemoprotein ethanol dehydrogenase